MDPQDQFKKRYAAYVSQRNTQTEQLSDSPPSPKKSFLNKFYFLGIIAGIVIILPVAYLFFTNRVKQQSPQVASTPQQTGGITSAQIDAELQKIWGPYYDKAKNGPKLRAVAENNIKLRLAAAKAGINTSSVASSSNPQQAQTNLESAVENKVVNSRTIDFISVYKNNLSPSYEKQKSEAQVWLQKIKDLTTQGKSLKEVYDQVSKMPSFDKSIKYFSGETVTPDSGWNQQFKDAIFNLKAGETSEVLVSPGGAMMLVDVTSANDTKYNNVQDWLNSQK